MRPVPRVEITGSMQSDTTYSVDYWVKSKNMQPRKKMTPQTHHGSGKFCGDTTYNVDFADCGKGSPVVVVKHGCSLGSSGAKLNGDTTYQTDFKGQPIAQKCLVLAHCKPTFICGDHMCY
jgi:hypothetical protein